MRFATIVPAVPAPRMIRSFMTASSLVFEPDRKRRAGQLRRSPLARVGRGGRRRVGEESLAALDGARPPTRTGVVGRLAGK
jgi:hypothetical protein